MFPLEDLMMVQKQQQSLILDHHHQEQDQFLINEYRHTKKRKIRETITPPTLEEEMLDKINDDDEKRRSVAVMMSSSKSKSKSKSNPNSNNSNVKKMMHRETERQRRQEMSALYASLRSLLPLHYIKGKRSVSDHMHEAVNYIKHMETSIKQLRLERDRLKKMTASSSSGSSRSNSTTFNNSQNLVSINCCRDGVEILISCAIEEKLGFPISKVLMELLKTGTNVVSFVSSKSDDRMLYKIQSDVCDPTYVNLSDLQQRLANVVN
ncbi:transcription factor bHLH36-like [Andrographis paniculata]|uniref:transcription factor bHLH36-like n=1 Tax=Andrographis paniculata TaxID=175694 RepID=UPI0021E959CC|nr:transcription factor bHLH36-like [Andrographis paniculata]